MRDKSGWRGTRGEMCEIWKKSKSDNYFKQKQGNTALQVQVSAGATSPTA